MCRSEPLKVLQFLAITAAVSIFVFAIYVAIGGYGTASGEVQPVGESENNITEKALPESTPSAGKSALDADPDVEKQLDSRNEPKTTPSDLKSAIDVPNDPEVQKVTYKYLKTGRTGVHLRENVSPEDLLTALNSVESVLRLRVSLKYLTPELVAVIEQSGNVVRVCFYDFEHMSEETAVALAKLGGVSEIEFGSPSISYLDGWQSAEDEVMGILARLLEMPDVSSVHTSGGFPVCDSFLEILTHKVGLRKILISNYRSLRRSRRVTNLGVQSLARMKELEELGIDNLFISGHRVDLSTIGNVLAGMPNLRVLSLAGWGVDFSDIEAALDVMKRLDKLDIRDTKLRDEFFRCVDETWALKSLKTVMISDFSARCISKITTLETLDITGSSLSTESIAAIIESNPNLIELVANNCQNIEMKLVGPFIGSSSIIHLELRGANFASVDELISSLPASTIKILNLAEVAVINVNSVEKVLEKCKELKYFAVYGNKNLRPLKVRELNKKYSAVAIVHAPGIRFPVGVKR